MVIRAPHYPNASDAYNARMEAQDAFSDAPRDHNNKPGRTRVVVIRRRL